MKHKFSDCLAMRMRRLTRVVDAQFRAIVKDYGISENQLSILFFLSKKSPVEQGLIGKAFYLERSTVSRNINVLQKMELVYKSQGHRPIIEITAKGLKIVKELAPKWDTITENLYQQLGEENSHFFGEIEKLLI